MGLMSSLRTSILGLRLPPIKSREWYKNRYLIGCWRMFERRGGKKRPRWPSSEGGLYSASICFPSDFWRLKACERINHVCLFTCWSYWRHRSLFIGPRRRNWRRFVTSFLCCLSCHLYSNISTLCPKIRWLFSFKTDFSDMELLFLSKFVKFIVR